MHNARLARRRWLLASLLVGMAAARADAAAQPVWLDLSEPLPAGARDAGQATERRERVAAQQDQVAQRLRELGITELARVVHSRNAMLVNATPQQLPALRAIPGVVRVRPERRLHPPKPMP